MEPKPVVLLIVEDDKAMRSLLCDELGNLGVRIVEASDGAEAVELISEAHPDIILTDFLMPAGGIDYLTRLRTLAPTCPIILLTAFSMHPKTRTEVLQQCSVAAYFEKPVRLHALKTAIERLLPDYDGSAQPN